MPRHAREEGRAVGLNRRHDPLRKRVVVLARRIEEPNEPLVGGHVAEDGEHADHRIELSVESQRAGITPLERRERHRSGDREVDEPLADVDAVGQAEGMLRVGLGNLFAVAEAYPDLKANESFQHLQARITGLENAIADRREFYNASVNANNVRIDQLPDLVVARALNFKPAQLLEFAADQVADVNLARLFQ